MKLFTRPGLVTICLSLSTFMAATNALATSQTSMTCPQKFIATVTDVEDVQAGAFPKVEVSFQIIQTLKGVEITSKKIQVIKGGPVEFKSGEIYTIESHDNWLCSATLFSKV